MKTKTQEQLEKEIKDIRGRMKKIDFSKKNPHADRKYSAFYNLKIIKKYQLSQHKTDIKNFEKLVGESKRCPNCPREIKCIQEKEIKEALKNL